MAGDGAPAGATLPLGQGRREGRAHRLIDLAARLLWSGAVLMLAGIGAASVVQLGLYGKQVAVGTSAGMVVWLLALGLAGCVAWGLVILNKGPFRDHPLATALAVLASSRLVDVALVPAPLESDFDRYHLLAIDIAQHGLRLDAVPAGYPAVLAAIYKLLGPNPLYAQFLNVAIAVATAVLLFDLTRRLWDERAATVALWFFVIAPAQILMTGVLATEAPYGLLLMLALWISIRLTSKPLLAAVLIGIALAASNYVRATTPALLPAFMLLPFLVPAVRLRKAAVCSLAMAAAFLICLTPVVAWNLQTRGDWSVSPSYYGGWSLLVGTDPAHSGSYNQALIAQVGGAAGTPDFDKRAGQLAIERLKARPLAFAGLAVKKFPRMWGREDYGTNYTLDWTNSSDKNESEGLLFYSQAAYLALAGLALLGLWTLRRDPPPQVVAIAAIMLALLAVHTFLEVAPRYHAYVEPLWCILAGAGVAAGHPIERGRAAVSRLRSALP